MKKSFDYKQLISKAAYEMIEISTSSFDSLDPRHVIKVTRPMIDEVGIAKSIHRNYAEQLTSGIFPEETKKEMDKEIAIALQNEKDRIAKLPEPIIFVGHIIQVKNGKEVLLRISIPLDVALYFIFNKRKVDQMYIELDRMPLFEDLELRDKHFKKVIDDFKKENGGIYYTADMRKEYIKAEKIKMDANEAADNEAEISTDEQLIKKAIKVIRETKKASATLIQRKLNIGFPVAARILDTLEERGMVGPQEGSKPRETFL